MLPFLSLGVCEDGNGDFFASPEAIGISKKHQLYHTSVDLCRNSAGCSLLNSGIHSDRFSSSMAQVVVASTRHPSRSIRLHGGSVRDHLHNGQFNSLIRNSSVLEMCGE
jgi:hypothetical protein